VVTLSAGSVSEIEQPGGCFSAGSNRPNGVLPRRRCRGHLEQMRSPRQWLPCDPRHLFRIGAIYRDHHYPSAAGAVGAHIGGDIREIARGCLDRRIAEVVVGAVEVTKGAKSGERVRFLGRE